MLNLPELSLYISHTCDIGCASCFTYNNLNWGGHFKHGGELFELKDKVDFETVTILGGEPTTNPYLNEWMEAVEQVWLDSDRYIVTNGRDLNRITSKCPNWRERGWKLEISAHSQTDLDNVFLWFSKTYNNFSYTRFYDSTHEDGEWHYDIFINDEHVGEISEAWSFFKESLIAKPGEALTWDKLYDPEESHKNCIARECMYFVEGRFYRCARQALLPQLAKTFQINGAYKELAETDLGCTASEFVEWSKTRLVPQSQCQFCPWGQKIELPKISNVKKINVKLL